MSRDDPSPRSVASGATTGEDDARRAAFARQVRDALTHLYDPTYLQTHPLAHLVAHDRDPRSSGAGKALRQILLDAIESLHPLTGTKAILPSGTGYQILHLRYVEALDVPTIQSQLALGKSEYYREQQRALDAITSVLWDHWRDNVPPVAAASIAPSAASADDSPFVPPRSRHNLPLPTTTYIPRSGELVQVRERLSESRLLTITGPGGCGKTRLALEVSRECVDEYADGVWLVELAPLADADLVPQAVATALDLREAPDRPLPTILADYLRPREMLLILDNCEHVIQTCAQVVETLLHACPRLRILATSRELLGIAGEAAWRVPSLTVVGSPEPASDRENLAVAVLESEAGQLFVDRARLVSPSFIVTRENALYVAQVCQRLDGIPLAIELAAARVSVLSVDQIAARLDQRFRLLTGGNRTALRRQQTLRATIDWSYQLLSDAERALLRKLAVFAGGWTLEAAEAVCVDARVADSEDVLELLAHLATKSMVLVEEPSQDGRGSRRFRLSETMRQYAEEKLLEAGEAESIRNRHRDWFVELAERATPEMEGPNQRRWFADLRAEHDNLRAALAWGPAAPDGREALLRLAAALGRFWQTFGYLQEGIRWLEIALRESATPPHARARALNWLGHWVGWLTGDLERARQLLGESIALARACGDRRLLSMALRHASHPCRALGDYDGARRFLEEAVAVSRDGGYPREEAYNLIALGELLIDEGRLESAERILVEGLDFSRTSGDALPLCHALFDLGGIYLSRGDYARARAALREALQVERVTGSRFIGAPALALLGDVAWAEGDLEAALDWYREGLRLHQEWAHERSLRGFVTETLRHYATVCVAVGQHRRATRIFGAVSTMRDNPITRMWFDRKFGHTDPNANREALGEEAFVAAWAEGKAMTLEDAVKLALSEGDGEALI